MTLATLTGTTGTTAYRRICVMVVKLISLGQQPRDRPPYTQIKILPPLKRIFASLLYRVINSDLSVVNFREVRANSYPSLESDKRSASVFSFSVHW